jgi:hypothetical protein
MTDAVALIDGIDDAFWVGMGRLGPAHLATLEQVQQAFVGTPLEARVTSAMAALRRSEFSESHFTTLAAARAALFGACHDALSSAFFQGTGRQSPTELPVLEARVQAPASHHEVYLEGVRQWLVEVAIGGFCQLSSEVIAPFHATLEQLQGEKELMGPATLVTGFVLELTAALPMSAESSAYVRRWSDLWMRSMLACGPRPLPAARETFTGTVQILGVESREHPFLSSVVFHALCTDSTDGTAQGGPPNRTGAARLYRATLSTWKVDVVFGIELWKIFRERAPNLVGAFADGRVLTVKEMPVSTAGDLFWDDARAFAGGTAVGWEGLGASMQDASILPPTGMHRHPTLLGFPVFFEGISIKDGAVVAGGTKLPLALERTPMHEGFSLAEIHAATSMMVLLRFDNDWRVQPLAITDGAKGKGKNAGPKVIYAGASLANGKAKVDTLAVLKAKASRLLRKKA